MAKCSLCKSRKGKRKCLAEESFICSLCCGQSRTADKCEGCSYFKTVKQSRNYRKAPHFTTEVMAQSLHAQEKANGIEAALCRFDDDMERKIDDNIVSRLIELLLDKYHFKDGELSFNNKLEENGFQFMDAIVQKELASPVDENLIKTLGAVYRSIKRHTTGRREYLDFIHQYVGMRVADGVRVLPDFMGS